MICPHCQATLLMTDRQGVEIDYCPKCRGVWLDRGELQKLIDSSLSFADNVPPRGDRSDERVFDDRGYQETRRYPERHVEYDYRKPKKKESWFSEIFDFD